MATDNWQVAVQPLINEYKGRKHPLNYNSPYELLVMVVLAAQDADRNINKLAPKLFEAFPDMTALSGATFDSLIPFISSVRSSRKKTQWLMDIATALKTNENIPRNLKDLTALPGVGRKSANVILREIGAPAEGVAVDLHVVRVAPRLGMATGSDPKKIEKQIMDVIDRHDWAETGMAISFLGREICRPTNPKCPVCVMKPVCTYYKTTIAPALAAD